MASSDVNKNYASCVIKNTDAGTVFDHEEPDVTLKFKTRQFEHEDLQKKTFTKWINAQFAANNRPLLTDLFDDLRDGTKLLSLLTILTGRELKPEIGRMRVHQLNNVNQVIQLLNYFNVKLVNISSDHIVDGNPKMTLGLVWSIIQHWQMEDILKTSDDGAVQFDLEKKLLEWCIQSTSGYRNVNVTNFTSSWADGLAFNALLHRFYPDLFDYDQLVGCDSLFNLRHAFSIASEKLGIMQLLDAEDVCVANPDKKSIMMYITCCYQVLSKSSRNNAPTTYALLHDDNRISFQTTLESVLMWLLDAQDKLTKQAPVAEEVQLVKEQFQQHEEFMVQLTVQQGRIGHVLHVGSQLLADPSTSDDVAQQIEAQMALLNNHWEELRIKAMDRQTSLQQVLMSLQQRQLDKLSEWLKLMESQLEEYSQWNEGINQQTLQIRQDKLRVLQEDVENEQEHVNRLQNMVVVVDETNSDEACMDLEKQLESLGIRWGSVCRTLEELSADLEKAASSWKDFDSRNTEFCDWLTQSELNVSQLSAVNNSTDMSTITEQVRLLKVLECEVDEWIPRFEELQVRGKKLNQVLDDTASVQIEQQLQSLQSRWDAFIQRMEQRSFEIIQSGVELNVTKADKESQVITVTRKSDKAVDSRSVTVPALLSPASKRRRVDGTITPVSVSSEVRLQAEIETLHSVINEFSVEKAIPADGSLPDSGQRLTLCTEKLNELLMNKSRLITLNERIHEELAKSTDSPQLETELVNLNQHWADTVQKLSDYQLQLKTARAPTSELLTAGNLQDQLNAFISWLDEVEKLLTNQRLIVDEQELVEQQLSQYLLLQSDVESHQKAFAILEQSTKPSLQKSPPDDVSIETLRADWQKVQERWAGIVDAVGCRVSQCQSTVDQIKQYQVQIAAIKQWISEMEEFIQPFTESFTTVETLQDQLREIQAVEQDVKTMESSLLMVSNAAQTLMEAAGSGAFHEKLRVEIEQLKLSFVEVTRAMMSQNNLLSSVLEQVQNLLKEIQLVDVRIDELSKECQKLEIRVENNEDFIRRQHELKDFVMKLSPEEAKVRHINDEASSLTRSTVMLSDFEDLNKPLIQLNLNWAQLQSQANDKSAKVQTMAQNYATFTGLIRDEIKWLDQLERKLSVGPRPSGDAEELSEELDELENFIHSQKQGNQTQLTGLAQTLQTNNVMVSSVSADMASYKQRNEALIAKAKQMMVHLEESIMQAQSRESRILDMSQWMSEMNDLLQSRLDADILAGDVPKEYETLKAEFAQQERLLQELEADSKTFHEQKKPEAAERLEQQIALLKRHFAEVSVKFAKFQRPADFDTKHIHVKRMLDDIDQRLHLIELTSSDLESVQNKLEQCMVVNQGVYLMVSHTPRAWRSIVKCCMREASELAADIDEKTEDEKFYRTMSEIKPDVEYVIKTGRQIVEKKQVDFPSMLTSQIDAIKQQYNQLGGLITGSKTTLEKACKLLGGLTQELANVQSFVEGLRMELVSRESSNSCTNVDEELDWLQVMLVETDRKRQLAVSLDEALVQFSRLSEDILITETEQEIRHVDEQLSEITARLQSRRHQLEEDTNEDMDVRWNLQQALGYQHQLELVTHWDKQYSEFDSCQNVLLLWLNNAEVALRNVPGSSNKGSGLSQLQAEKSQRIGEVDHVRDLAVDLINNSGKHRHLVETQLAAFNQRWLDVDELLKSQVSITSESSSSPVGSKVSRATAALQQLLSDSTSDGASTDVVDTVLVDQLNSNQTGVVDTDEDVVKKLMDIKPDERRTAVDVRSPINLQQIEQQLNAIERQINQRSNLSQSELKALQSEIDSCQTKIVNLQLSGNKALVVSTLEKKLSELRSRYASVSTHSADEHAVELQISSPVLSSAPVSDFTKSSSSQLSASTVVTETVVHTSVTNRLTSSTRTTSVSTSKETQAESGSMPKLDSFINKLDNFAVVLSEKARSYPVIIGQINEIEQAAVTKRTIEKDLKLMKPQIEAIVSKCEALKNESSSEQYNHMLNDNVNRLCQCWQSAIETVAERHGVLEQMLTDCRQYSVSYTETDRWILHNIEMYDTDNIGADVATIKQQIDILESERLEILGSRNRVEMVVQQAQILINKYKFDDPSRLGSDMRLIEEHWQDLMTRLSEREKSLQNAVNAMYRFDSDMKNCLLWLTKVEVVLNHHNDMSADVQQMDERQLNQIRDAIIGLQSEIDSQKSVLESLNTTARQIKRTSTSATVGTNLQTQLDDMNKRMAKLSSRAIDISNRLKSPPKPNVGDELKSTLTSLLQWLSVKSNDIARQRPIGGDIQSVKQQLDIVQFLQSEMNAKQSEYDDCIVKGQKLIQQDAKDLSPVAAVPDVHRMVREVQEMWATVREKSDILLNDLDETLEKLAQLQDALEDLCQHLVSLERETMKWKPIANILVEDLQNQIDYILKFQQRVAPTQSEVDHCNDLANQFTDVVLSHKNVSQLEDLNKRWLALHQAVEVRLQQLQEALYEFGPQSQQLLAASVVYPWQRAVSSNSVPYYIDHKNESTHWDHPEMTKILQSLVDFNDVKFSAYRTAMKLHKLQKSLNLDLVDLESVDKVFTAMPNARSGSDPVAVVSVPDIINTLVALFEPLTIRAPMSREVNIPLSIDLVLNWLLNVYDSGRSGHMRANSFKVALVLMCNAQYEDKYRSIYRVAANVGNKLDRHGLTTLLRDCIQIPKQLGEVAAFGGSNVEPSVQSCFEKAANQPGVTPAQFVDWMKLEPQSMVWIPVMHRVSAAESSRHQVRCSICRTSPISGIRYRCLKCFSFDMCQKCFFAGQTAKSHKLTHPMQEYCGTTTSSEDVRDFTKVFKNKFRSKQYFKKHPRLGYLPVQTVLEGGTLERSTSEDTSLRDASDNFASSTAASVASTPRQRHGVADSHGLNTSLKGGSTSMLEMHSRVGIQAKRLHEAERRQKHMAKSVDMEDEHNLIAQYCKNLQGHRADSLKSPMQIMAGLDADQEAEMEAVIRELESENRALQAEYDELLLTHRDPTVHPDTARQLQSNGVSTSSIDDIESRDAELLAEAKQLAKHKTQLEVRMRILEDHNRQLEAQLQRLHLLLDQPESNGAHVVTFSAAERNATPLSTSSSHSSLPRRDPPTFASYQQSIRDRNVSNGTYSASEQRLLSEEEELDRMMKELQETFPSAEGANNVDSLFQTVGQVSKAVGTLVNIMTVDNDETHPSSAKQLTEPHSQRSHSQK